MMRRGTIGQQPALKPAKQKRSRAAADRMLAAGHELLETRDIDQLSIQEIAAHARSSVGSFYLRFGTKERYFQALIQDMIELREEQAEGNFSRAFPDLPAVLARGAITNFRKHQGLIRSAIRQHLLGKDVWAPIAQMAQRFVVRFCERAEKQAARPLSNEERQRIAFAFVWLYGMLAESVMRLNSIYEYGIAETEFEEEAVRIFVEMINMPKSLGEE